MLLIGEAPVSTSNLLVEPGAQLAEKIRRRGGSRIQVNVVDPSLGPPHGMSPAPGSMEVTAMVSYWVDAAGEDGIHAGLPPAAVGSRWCGYLVSEALQLAGPPAAGDGSRCEGFTQIVPLSVPPDLSWGEWRRRWQGSHTSVAIETQSSFRYVQNLVVRPLDEGAPAFAAIVEESFPLGAASDVSVFYDAVGDPGRLDENTRRMMDSCARFIRGAVPIAWTAEYRLAG